MNVTDIPPQLNILHKYRGKWRKEGIIIGHLALVHQLWLMYYIPSCITRKLFHCLFTGSFVVLLFLRHQKLDSCDWTTLLPFCFVIFFFALYSVLEIALYWWLRRCRCRFFFFLTGDALSIDDRCGLERNHHHHHQCLRQSELSVRKYLGL